MAKKFSFDVLRKKSGTNNDWERDSVGAQMSQEIQTGMTWDHKIGDKEVILILSEKGERFRTIFRQIYLVVERLDDPAQFFSNGLFVFTD